MKYRYSGPMPVFLPLLARRVEPGDVVETDREINHPHFERQSEPRATRAKDAPEPAQEGD